MVELGAGMTAPEVFKTVAGLPEEDFTDEEDFPEEGDFPGDETDFFCWLICFNLLLILDFMIRILPLWMIHAEESCKGPAS